MLTIDAKSFEKDMMLFLEELTSRIEKGVEQFITDITYILIDDTPYGDVDKFLNLYEIRQEKYGFDIAPGLAKGSWLVTTGSLYMLGAISYDKPNGYYSKIRTKQTVQEYTIGETVYITNSVPYILELNEGSSKQLPQGFKSSLEKIETIYSINLGKYFKKQKQKVGKVERL